jgi:hypothetical protein
MRKYKILARFNDSSSVYCIWECFFFISWLKIATAESLYFRYAPKYDTYS